MFRRLKENQFANSVAKLVSGTAFAQALGLLALPLLTRLYSPENFGTAGIFMAILSIVAAAASLRYHVAIPLPKSDKTALELMCIALGVTVAFSLVTAIAVYFLTPFARSIPSVAPAAPYLWLLPIGVLLTSAYTVFQFWATRERAFGQLARTRIEQATGSVAAQLAMGWFGAGAIGLIIGQIVSNGAGFFGLAKRAWKHRAEEIININLKGLWATAKEYSQYPRYSTPEALTNIAGLQLPLLFISTYAGSAELGFVLVVSRVLQGPMSLIGGAIGQVYYSHAVELHRDARLHQLTKKTALKLAAIGVPLMLGIGALAPFAAEHFFGAAWARAGVLTAWLAPYFLLQFIASPLSMTLHVAGKQRWALLLQLFGFLFRTGAVIAFDTRPAQAFAISSAVFYGIYLATVFAATKTKHEHTFPS